MCYMLSPIGLVECKGLDEYPINVVTASPELLRLAYQSEEFLRRNRQAIEKVRGKGGRSDSIEE